MGTHSVFDSSEKTHPSKIGLSGTPVEKSPARANLAGRCNVVPSVGAATSGTWGKFSCLPTVETVGLDIPSLAALRDEVPSILRKAGSSNKLRGWLSATPS